MERLEADVAALAAMPRGSATHEATTADWLVERLAAAGLTGERRTYTGRTTYAWSFALFGLAGLSRRRWLRAAAVAGLELDASGRAPLPLGRAQGTNVVARVPAKGEKRRTLVLAAHHDTQRTGLVWHPALNRLGAKQRLKNRSIPPYLPIPALSVLFGIRPLALLASALAVEQALRPAVPGANDNATGVAAVMALLERYAADPLDDTEVVGALVGGEESGMLGMRAFLKSESFDPQTTLVISLDTLGCGTPIVLRAEHALLRHSYAERDLELVPPEVERWSIGGWTDALQAKFAGLRALSLLSIGPAGVFTHYHVPDDVPEHVDFDSVAQCLGVAIRICEAWAQTESPHG